MVGLTGNINEATNIASELLNLHKYLSIALAYNLTLLQVNEDCQDILHCLQNDHPSYSTIFLLHGTDTQT